MASAMWTHVGNLVVEEEQQERKYVLNLLDMTRIPPVCLATLTPEEVRQFANALKLWVDIMTVP